MKDLTLQVLMRDIVLEMAALTIVILVSNKDISKDILLVAHTTGDLMQLRSLLELPSISH